jgi:hypothetical protein
MLHTLEYFTWRPFFTSDFFTRRPFITLEYFIWRPFLALNTSHAGHFFSFEY